MNLDGKHMNVWAKVGPAVASSWSSSANRREFRLRRLIVSEGGRQSVSRH